MLPKDTFHGVNTGEPGKGHFLLINQPEMAERTLNPHQKTSDGVNSLLVPE